MKAFYIKDLQIQKLQMITLPNRNKKFKYVSVGTKRSKEHPKAYNLLLSIDVETANRHKNNVLEHDYDLVDVKDKDGNVVIDKQNKPIQKLVFGIEDNKVLVVVKSFKVDGEQLTIRFSNNVQVVRHCFTAVDDELMYTPVVIMDAGDMMVMENQTKQFIIRWNGTTFTKITKKKNNTTTQRE